MPTVEVYFSISGTHTIHNAGFWCVYWTFFYWDKYKKKEWLLVGTCNPNKNLISNHLKEIDKNFDNYSPKYDNFIILGDLYSEPTESAVRDFWEIYSCKNLIKDNTCFKNPSNPSCIDLIIKNQPKSFRNSVTVETGSSDFQKMTLTVMEVFYKKTLKYCNVSEF